MTLATLILTAAAVVASGGAADGGRPVLLDFHAEWCGPCRQMRPEIAKLVGNHYPIKSIDVDRSPEVAKRYKVGPVPSFVVVGPDGEVLARSTGYQPAADLAEVYNRATTQFLKTRAAARSSDARPKVLRAADRDEVVTDEDPPAVDEPPAVDDPEPADDSSPEPRAARGKKVPGPWETVVRIKVDAGNLYEYGSGTVISSTEKEAIILTCAHIFHVNGRSKQFAPSEFPHKISIDLFDGLLQGPKRNTVHPVQTVKGRAIDYDFTHDVGLIRITPGRKLPVSPVVPAGWRPSAKLAMTAVGCSEGQDATAWTTYVLQPRVKGGRDGRYEGMECSHAPLQGRSGGGLYTHEGYIAGVCDFADYRNNHGIYAAPESIHRLLDRNRLTALYVTKGADDRSLLADRRPTRRGPESYVRLQNDDRPEGKTIPMPRPELLGIRPPVGAAGDDGDGTLTHPARKPRRGWLAATQPADETPSALLGSAPNRTRGESTIRPASEVAESEGAREVDMRMDPSVDREPAATPAPHLAPKAPPSKSKKWRAASPSATADQD